MQRGAQRVGHYRLQRRKGVGRCRCKAVCPTDVDRIRVGALSHHWFRHRRAMELTKRLTITQVAQYLDHASIETTKAYVFDDELDLARTVLNTSG